MNEPLLTYSMPRDALRADLSLLGTIAKPRHGRGGSHLPVLMTVHLGGNHIAATNLDVSAARFSFDFAGPVWGVEFEPLAELAKVADKGSVIMVEPPTEDNASATITATVQGSAMSRAAAFFATAELPSLGPPEVKFDGAPQLFDAFGIEQIRRAANFASRDDNRYVLNGVCLDNRQADGRIVSTDGRRLFCSKAFSWVNLPKEKSFILPLHPLWHARQLDGPWYLRPAVGDRCNVEVHAGGWKIISKLVDGNYPNWRQIMPKDRPADVFAARIDWQEAKNLPAWIKALPSGKDKHPSLQVTGNGHLEFTHVASGAHRQLDARSEGRHVTAHFNAAFVSELCAMGFRSWELVDELTPLVARSDAGDTVIVMPLRMNDPEPVAAEAAPETPASDEPVPAAA